MTQQACGGKGKNASKPRENQALGTPHRSTAKKPRKQLQKRNCKGGEASCALSLLCGSGKGAEDFECRGRKKEDIGLHSRKRKTKGVVLVCSGCSFKIAEEKSGALIQQAQGSAFNWEPEESGRAKGSQTRGGTRAWNR